MTSTTSPSPSTTNPPPPTDAPKLENDIKYLIIPIVVVVVIMILSALVYLMAKRRHNQQVREIILSLYDLDYDRDEWEPLNSYDHDSYDATGCWQQQQAGQYNTSYV